MSNLSQIKDRLESISLQISALSMSFSGFTQMAVEGEKEHLEGRLCAVTAHIESLLQNMNQVNQMASTYCSK